MSLSFEVYLVVTLLLLYVDIIIVLKIITNRLKATNKKEKHIRHREELVKGFSIDSRGKSSYSFSDSYYKLKDSMILEENLKEVIEKGINITKLEKSSIKKLSSLFTTRRIEGAVNLGSVGSETGRKALEKALKKEKSYPVKIYIANALSDIGNEKSIPVLIESLINGHRWYRNRVNMLIADFGDKFHKYLPEIIHRKEAEIKELIVDFASVYFSVELKEYLIKIIEEESITYSKDKYVMMDKLQRCCGNCVFGRKVIDSDKRQCEFKGTVNLLNKCRRFKRLPVSIEGSSNRRELVYKAADIVANFYPKVLKADKYLNSNDGKIRNIAIKALIKEESKDNLDSLISYLYNEETAKIAIEGITDLTSKNPELIQVIIKKFTSEEDLQVKAHVAEILSRKIEYLIIKLISKDKKTAGEIIQLILLSGKTSEVIDFLNKNRNIDIENELIAILKNVMEVDNKLQSEFTTYLNERILGKCGINKVSEVVTKREEKKDENIIRTLYSIILAIILIFPIIYVVRHFEQLTKLDFITQLKIYVTEFNYYIAFYAIAINLIYLVLLLLSIINVRRQAKLWKLKTKTLLFKKRMLPGVSIIAPAFNEEKTIIESANSLLNLIYPDYELIIVNDGSRDSTLEVLIRNFNLKRVDYSFDYKLDTKSVRGVYMNKSIPKLIVVDKINGGKADSLNAGINISRKEYFCGIDADSLLEADALLKLASMVLDAGLETPALGGNIFPANGCTIDKGTITEIKIPENKLARFQTIEYIRAFMAGRLGWAYTNNLLIISGAFGLFRKERVISVGGYLTSSGKYKKDTVGEDMELVVRIVRLMREKGLRYKIDYAYNANCWTEVPEEMKSLKSQRFRWHRGLIDILTFHKKMLFNPAYGRTGTTALPYFFIFEMIGPLVELQGYIMVVVAWLLGLLNLELALLLFVGTVFMGVLISLFSIIIAEKDREYFKLKDIGILTLYSIIENFGPRQLFSFWRSIAMLRMLWKAEGWGKVERKGFTANVDDKKVR